MRFILSCIIKKPYNQIINTSIKHEVKGKVTVSIIQMLDEERINNCSTSDAPTAVLKCLYIFWCLMSMQQQGQQSADVCFALLSVCHLFHPSTGIKLKEKRGILFSYFLASAVLKSN